MRFRSSVDVAGGRGSRPASVVALLLLLYGSNAFLRYIWPDFGRGSGNPTLVVLWLGVGLAAGVTAAWRGGLRRAFTSIPPPFVALPLIAALSVTWSRSPALTVSRVIGLLISWTAGYALSTVFDADTIAALAVRAAAVIAVGAYAAAAISGSDARDVFYPEYWRGPFLTKNELGRFMVLGLALAAARRAVGTISRGRLALQCGLFLPLPFLAGSASAVVALVALVTLVAMARLVQAPGRRLAVVGTALVAVPVALATFAAAGGAAGVLGLLNRDATFTGRTNLWSAVLEAIAERPFFGYGYGAFWADRSGPAARVVREAGFDTPHAHNGALDLALQLGLVGAVVGTVAIAAAVVRAAALVRAGERRGVLVFAFFNFLILYNLTESAVFLPNNTFTMLTFAFAYSLSRPSPKGGREDRQGRQRRQLVPA